MESLANMLGASEGDLIWLLVVAAIAIITKIANAIKAGAKKSRQEEERRRREQESGQPMPTMPGSQQRQPLPPPVPPMTPQSSPGVRHQMPAPRIRPRVLPGQEAAPLPQHRPSPVEITEARQRDDATQRRPATVDIGEALQRGESPHRRPSPADAGGATAAPIRRTPPPVRQGVVRRPVVAQPATMDMRVDEELAHQRRRMEQEDAKRGQRMATKAPAEADTQAIAARLVHINKGQAPATGTGRAMMVNLMLRRDMRQAILFHEILSPPKALREEADLPALR